MFPDFKDLLRCFHVHGVKYLIVGGYAVSFHSQPRATKDLDLFIKADPENAALAYAALSSFGAPLEGVTVHDLVDPRKFIRFGRPPVLSMFSPASMAWTLIRHGRAVRKRDRREDRPHAG
jgi:hypothetical protein